jgi:N-acetylglucosaminyldiphosphoundecaprenol N-acetyl-beta-D-mannosaminyltransferase
MKNFQRVDILGCPFDAASFAEAVQCIREAVLSGRKLQIVPGSIDSVIKAKSDPAFASQLHQSDLVVADGVPIVWSAALLGTPIRGRVSGTELVWSCAQVSAETGAPVALIGGRDGIASRAAEQMLQRHPGAVIHAIPTPWPLGHTESVGVARQAREVGTRIALVALGAPRQERWVQAYLGNCGACVGIGVGSAFDIISGDQPRAPQWMQNAGLEWLHRMLLEPRRLGRRYLLEDSPYVLLLAKELARRRTRRVLT